MGTVKTLRWLLSKIDLLVGKIPLDFTLHFIVSAGIAWLFMLLLALNGLGLLPASVAATTLAIAVGVAKEYVVDKEIKQTEADVLDLAADVTGSVFGVLMCASGALMF